MEFPWLDDLMREPGMLPWSSGLQPQLGLSNVTIPSPATTGSELHIVPEYLIAPEGHRSCTTMERTEKEAAVHRFKTWPDKWLMEGKAPFIHAQLYKSSMPKPLQDAYAACAIYATKTPDNEFVAFNIIEAKANELLSSPTQHSLTPLDLLAATQALLIFQFIRLFDGDIRQRAQAEKAEAVLEAWTEQLRRQTREEQGFTTANAPSWRSWIFAESVRRTITMSLFLSGVYHLVKKGFCTMSEHISANSFTAHRALWDASSELEWNRAKTVNNPHWVYKMNFDHLLQEAKGSELDDFGMIMIITYKSQEVFDHWLATTGADENIIELPNFHQSLMDMVQSTNASDSSPDFL